jgi:hypothetical protein
MMGIVNIQRFDETISKHCARGVIAAQLTDGGSVPEC